MFRIAVCDDEKTYLDNIQDAITRWSEERNVAIDIAAFDNGDSLLEHLKTEKLDMVFLDIMMPRMDGYELLKTIREEGNQLPFLLLTAKESLDDKQHGFSLGTDDYMTKPFSSDELLWRVGALLRRANIAQSKKIEIGNVVVDSEKYHAVRRNAALHRRQDRRPVPQRSGLRTPSAQRTGHAL